MIESYTGVQAVYFGTIFSLASSADLKKIKKMSKNVKKKMSRRGKKITQLEK